MCWIRRKGDEWSEAPELVTAWDGYSIEANFEGWQADVQRSLDAIGGDLRDVRFLNVTLDSDEILEHFREFKNVGSGPVAELDDPRNI